METRGTLLCSKSPSLVPTPRQFNPAHAFPIFRSYKAIIFAISIMESDTTEKFKRNKVLRFLFETRGTCLNALHVHSIIHATRWYIGPSYRNTVSSRNLSHAQTKKKKTAAPSQLVPRRNFKPARKFMPFRLLHPAINVRDCNGRRL
jgi:hypothetical protein